MLDHRRKRLLIINVKSGAGDVPGSRREKTEKARPQNEPG